ncbi:hypothetical protein FRIGORI9N_280037 [Frigoribacterium sp. 9N]|nr:hypothetical protein FRIGORI9N_280037 [Frigoribacterium sp. 9N]
MGRPRRRRAHHGRGRRSRRVGVQRRRADGRAPAARRVGRGPPRRRRFVPAGALRVLGPRAPGARSQRRLGSRDRLGQPVLPQARLPRGRRPLLEARLTAAVPSPPDAGRPPGAGRAVPVTAQP